MEVLGRSVLVSTDRSSYVCSTTENGGALVARVEGTKFWIVEDRPSFSVTLCSDAVIRDEVMKLPVVLASWKQIAQCACQVMTNSRSLVGSIASMEDLRGPFILHSFYCAEQSGGDSSFSSKREFVAVLDPENGRDEAIGDGGICREDSA